MLPKIVKIASGTFVPDRYSVVGFAALGCLPYFELEQFWGRAVRASRDSIIRDASYFCSEYFKQKFEV